MGDRGADHAEVPSEREIEEMARLTEEALRAGAMGFTTSRTTKHKAKDGRFTPSLSAREAELLGIAAGMKRAGTRRAAGQFRLRTGRVRGAGSGVSAGRPAAVRACWCRSMRSPSCGARRSTRSTACAQAGRLANAQVGSRPIGVIMGLETTAHPFAAHPAWLEMRKLSPAELQRAPRRRCRSAPPPDVDASRRGAPAFMAESFHKMFPVGDRPDYEPDADNSIAAIAQRSGRTPQEVALDELMAHGGKGLLMLPFENYAYGSLDVVHEMITDPATVLGVADGGAHVGVICDASSPTSLLTLWGRDRQRGPKLALEFLVAKQTRGTAEAYGLLDRGLLAPGHKADINVIDFDALALKRPEVVYDLPAGGRRLIQRASGYRHTFNAGVETVHNDELTGERPGRLVRGAQTPLHDSVISKPGERARVALPPPSRPLL